MKTDKSWKMLLLVLFVFVVASMFTQERVEWKGEVVKSAGVTIVKNPKEPIFDRNIFELKEELVINDYDPIGITDSEYEKLIDHWFGGPLNPKLDFIIPKHYPPFHTFLLDDEGRIYVRRFEEVEKGDRHFIEIFDSEGRYLTNVILPSNMIPCVLEKGNLYSIEETDEGYEVLKRYRIDWKD